MNILFLTLVEFNSFDERSLYHDLLRIFVKEGHNVTIVTPVERRKKNKTNIRQFNTNSILQVKTFNIQKTNIIEKGIGTIFIENQYFSAIKKYLSDKKFDLVLYSTPPITFTKIISYVKKRDNAKSYLLLKDIFPQNAVDIGLIKSNSLIYKFFRNKERKLYSISDVIGCMSFANVDFLRRNNTELAEKIIEVCPNSIELNSKGICEVNKIEIRKKYGIPTDSCVFVYGGNLGKPQGLDFLLKVIESNSHKLDRCFLVVGSGTEFSKIEQWFVMHKPVNAQLIPGIPKSEYDVLIKACDVGLIFLDPRFTIPNYPSRLLSYMENKMPVLMATDKNTDIGRVAEENRYGFWSENGNLNKFNSLIEKFCDKTFPLKEMGERGYKFLKENYTVEKSYKIIMKHFEKDV